MFQILDCRAPEFSTFLGLLDVPALPHVGMKIVELRLRIEIIFTLSAGINEDHPPAGSWWSIRRISHLLLFSEMT